MIGKIVTGKSFKGAVEYVLKKDGSRLLDSDGVDTESVRSVIDSFNYQRKARPEIAKVVAHISLSFLQDDAPRLTDEFMTTLAHEYMRRMGITDTQYIVVRHTDTEHPHIHIIYNRVRYDRKLVPDNNERRRNTKVCKTLKQKYGLTFSEGKQNVKVEKLHGPDQVKYAIFKAIKEVLPCCSSVESLAEQLLQYNIATTVVHRGGDPAKEIQGMTFTMDGQSFKASQIDRKFSYANLCKTIKQNRAEVKRKQELDTHNPVVYGVRLTDEQVIKIKDGEYVYLENMQKDDGTVFSGYIVMGDTLQQGWIYKSPPDKIIKEGRYYIREMDKLLADNGYVVRAKIRFWNERQSESRQYLWRDKNGFYDSSPDDPRKPKPPRQELHVPSIPSRKKSRGGQNCNDKKKIDRLKGYYLTQY